MLPSWRDEIRIALCPDRVALARVSRRWRPEITARQVVHCSGAAVAPGEDAWRPCLEALREVLQEPRLQDADASVVLSNHFVRYALVPWSEHLAGDDEKRAWVSHHFDVLYGAPRSAIELRWSEEGPDAECVASAVDAGFMAALRAAFDSSRLRLCSIQPYLMAVFNRWRGRIGSEALWLVAPEPGHVCMAALAHGRWRAIASRTLGPDWRAELPLLLGRELLLAEPSDAPAAVWAYAPEDPQLDFPGWSGSPLKFLAQRPLRGYSPREDAGYAMALTGVA